MSRPCCGHCVAEGSKRRPAPPSWPPSNFRCVRIAPFMPSTVDDLLGVGRSLWLKMAACSAVTLAMVAAVFLEGEQEPLAVLAAPATVISMLGAVVVGALIGVALSMKDVVEQRVREGKPVAFPLKLLFGFGFASALLWMLLVILTVFAVTMIALAT